MKSVDGTILYIKAANGKIELWTQFGVLLASSDAKALAMAVREAGGFTANCTDGVSTREPVRHGFASQEAFDALYFEMFDALRKIGWR